MTPSPERHTDPSGRLGLTSLPLPVRRRRPVPVILDTDMNEDVDDAGALALLHALADKGLAEILGLTYCTSAQWGIPAIRAINRWYGRPDIPVGSLGRPGFIEEYADLSYIRFLAKAYEPDGAVGPGGERKAAPDAVALLRRILAGRSRADVVLVGIGPMPNLAALLDSGPDEACPLTGPDLVRRSVRKLVLMCGRIPSGIEYNLRQDPAAAQFCREAPRGNPVRTAYWLHAVGLDWPCFDQVTVLAALTGTRYFRLSAPGRLEVDREGCGAWRPDPFGRTRYLKMKFGDAPLSRLVEDLMLAPPRLGTAGAIPPPTASDEELLERRKVALAAHFRAVMDEGLEELEGAE